MQDRERHQVDGEADGGDDEHQTGADLRRLADPADRLDEHVAGDAQQQQAVRDGGEDLDPLPAEGAPSACGSLGEGDRAEGQRDAGRVGGHVARVGQQGQRAGHHGADDLGGQHGQRSGPRTTASRRR